MIIRTLAPLAGAMWVCVSATSAAAQGGMAGMPGMAGMEREEHAAGPLGIPMERMGSGTTWIPDAVPVPSRSWTPGSWDVMAHGVAWLQYDHQSGPRGDGQLGSLNWLMIMASRVLAGGRLQPRVMLSLDPATVTGRGYPLLLQSGETYGGAAIRDRQHPHDFWMELGVLYERAVSPTLGVSIYAAPSGEPALGPVAYMHRPSALDNPFAPLSHHRQDATHISYGVLTGGVFGRRWKLEGSAFNGREPDEQRWTFDRPRLDSWSARATVNPTPGLSLTAGFGRIESPEPMHPDESLHRATASLLYGGSAGGGTRWSGAVVWGRNAPIGGGVPTDGLLAEASLVRGAGTLLARGEYVEKTAEELSLPGSTLDPDRVFGVAALSVGAIRDFGDLLGLRGGVGGLGTLNRIGAALGPSYGSRSPWGATVFLRVRPEGGADDGMTHHGMERAR